MHPNSISLRLLFAAGLIVPGALATGVSVACSQGSANAEDTTAVASNDAPSAQDADMKKVILNVFGMT